MPCQFCDIEHTTVVYHGDGDRVSVFECDTCGDPLCVLTAHDDEPTLETQAYALGVVRGLFGPGVAFRDATHAMPPGHWAAHVDVPTG